MTAALSGVRGCLSRLQITPAYFAPAPFIGLRAFRRMLPKVRHGSCLNSCLTYTIATATASQGQLAFIYTDLPRRQVTSPLVRSLLFFSREGKKNSVT